MSFVLINHQYNFIDIKIIYDSENNLQSDMDNGLKFDTIFG